MSPNLPAILLTVALSLLAVVGDYFLKVAGRQSSPFLTPSFLAGLALYAVSAFGAVYVFREIKMASVGGIYCASLVLFLTLMGALVFNETLSCYECVGLCLAVASVVMLGRFAS